MASGLSHSFVLGLVLCLPLARGSGDWEWAGTFDLTAGHYTWSCTKAESGSYADATAKLLIYPLTDSSQASFEAIESAAETMWSTSTSVSSYAELEASTTYTLNFDDNTWTTHFIVHIDTPGAYAFIFEHSPYEFENGFHYLRSEAGEDVEPVYEEESHAGHDHGTGTEEAEEHCPWTMDWEWSAIFAVSEGWYDWNAEKVDGAYPDAHMKIVILATTGTDIHDLETDAQTKWDAIGNTETDVGETIPIGAGTTLHFDTDTWASHFKIQVPAGTTHIAVFAEHFPIEFEDSYHFLKDATGADIEPVVEESGAECASDAAAATTTTTDSSTWGEVIIASVITVLPTLVGIILVGMLCVEKLKGLLSEEGTFQSALHSFASGVIFAAAVFLLLPEGLYLITVGKTEAGGAGAWGTSVMGGWLFCILIKHFCQLVMGEKSADVREVEKESAEEEGTPRTSWLVSFPILFGDMFHNFSDGLVLGVAFKTCGPSFGWKLTWITVLHEVPQELSDFAVLITKGKMWWPKATVLNFLSGCSTIVGAIITYSMDVSQGVEGAILASGAGVYLYVAMTELGPAVGDLLKDRALGSIARILSFAVGATLIGLVLLDHEHCFAPVAEGEEGEAAEADDGHGHGH
jgi:zinc transporter ZupT